MPIFIKERRRGNYWIAFGLAAIFAVSMIFVIKYYELQARYWKLISDFSKINIP